MTVQSLLRSWLASRLSAESMSWLQNAIDRVRGATTESDLLRYFSLVARRIPRQPLNLSDDALRDAQSARVGWDPREWSGDQAARILLVLSMEARGEVLARRLEQLFVTADVAELIALYRGLPLCPDAPRFVLRAAEGVRSNMKSVFEAVAHRNPFPSEHFTEGAWNQMVLKALFVGSRLAPVVGLDERSNPALARMLTDYAHERWAANRPISPELWRCVGPFATGSILTDLERVLIKGTPSEQQAAALALSSAPDSGARAVLHNHADLASAVRAGRYDWQTIAQAV